MSVPRLPGTSATGRDDDAIPVFFVLLPQVLMLDLAGPAAALRLASQLAGQDTKGPPCRFALRYVSVVERVETSIRSATRRARAAA